MQKIIAILLLSLTSTAYALPNCPSDESVKWHNCFGAITYPNGNKYVGEFQDDKRHGQGTATFPSGDKHVGEFKDGMRHGQGTYTFASGDKYVGEWKNNMRHGQGTYTFPSGTKENGYFMNNEYVPDICEGMGLSKGTSEFGQCVLELIDAIVQ